MLHSEEPQPLPLPKTTWRPSSQLVTTVVMKNLHGVSIVSGVVLLMLCWGMLTQCPHSSKAIFVTK